MPRERLNRCPYPSIHVSDEQRQHLIEVVNSCVHTNFQKYENFLVTDKHQVDERQWDRIKAKDDLHVYIQRSIKDQVRKGIRSSNALHYKDAEREMVALMSVGTVVGELEDLIFGIVNTTHDSMRIRAAYLGDINAGAILCPVVEPSEKEPFRSLAVKWMATEASMRAGKSRDFVCIEVTDILHLDTGERIGYHVLHSVEFPQTRPTPNVTRGNMSSVSFFQPIHSTIIDTFGSCVIDPGLKVKRLQFIPSAANAMLTATSYVHCGQMKKLAWMLQCQHAGFKLPEERHQSEQCVMCGKSRNIPGLSRSTCKLCYGHVCYSCKVRARMNFIGQEAEVIERKITFCSQCMSRAINCSTKEAAQNQAVGYQDSYDSASTFSDSTYSESSLYH